MIPAQYNFPDHYKGDTFLAKNIKFNFDITGAIVELQFKTLPIGQTIFKWKTGENITTVDALNGEIILQQIDCFDVQVGTYQYDLQITFASGSCFTYLKGTIKVIQDVTR